MDGVNHGLAALLVNSWAVPVLLSLLALLCAGILLHNYRRRYDPLSRALTTRLDVLRPVDTAGSVEEAQACFADDFDRIDGAMRERDGSAALSHAWLEYSETIVDPAATPVQSTSRPDDYFLHLGDDTRVLAWWANLFVGLGLTFTFLGIIAALTKTSDDIHKAGENAAGMSGALVVLLTLTAAKFWTSVVGVAASIVLRYVDRLWFSRTQRRLAQVSHAIERGTCFIPAQRIAADQLRELKQQTTALSEFSTQLAVGIADALGEKMQPVVLGLQGIQGSIDEFKTGSFDQIGKGLADAMNEHAGTEMQALAGALAAMTSNLSGVNDRLEGASGAASEQIAGAAREFSTASEAMTRAFERLNGNIDAMATRLAEQGEAAEQRARDRIEEERSRYDADAKRQRDDIAAAGDALRQSSVDTTAAMVAAVRDAIGGAMADSNAAIKQALDGFAGATAGIQQALDATRAQVAEMGQHLASGASDAADRNAEVLAKAAAALEAASARASAGMGRAVDDAITKAADASAQAIAGAFAGFRERFEAASGGLVTTLTTTAGRMEALAGAIERSTGAAGDHAGKLAEAGREAQAVGTMLGRAANDVATAAGPLRDASGTIREAVGQTRDLLLQSNNAGARYQAALETVTGSLERTGAAAAQAWESYRTRFDAVDESLGRALDRMASASQEHAAALTDQVGRVDKALGDAVDRLGSALEPLTEYAETLEDLRSRMQEAAE